MQAPADDGFELPLLYRRPHLKSRLEAGTHQAEHLGVFARQVLDRHGRGGGGAQGRQVVASDYPLGPTRVRIERKTVNR